MDPCEAWRPPMRCASHSHPIVVAFSRNAVNISAEDLPLLAAALGARDCVAWSLQWSGCASPWRFLVEVASLTSCKGHLFMQFVIGAGVCLDNFLASAFVQGQKSPTSAASGASQAGVPPASAALHGVGLWDSEKATRSSLLKYWLCGRRLFQDGSFMSISVDDSRVGGLTRMSIAAALPNNYAVFCPPQALELLGGGLGGNPNVPIEPCPINHVRTGFPTPCAPALLRVGFLWLPMSVSTLDWGEIGPNRHEIAGCVSRQLCLSAPSRPMPQGLVSVPRLPSPGCVSVRALAPAAWWVGRGAAEPESSGGIAPRAELFGAGQAPAEGFVIVSRK